MRTRATTPHDERDLYHAVVDMFPLLAERFEAPLTLPEAIHAGLLLRLHEILRALAALTEHQPAPSITRALSRMALETAVDIEYLSLNRGDGDLYRNFALSGLKAEHDMLQGLEDWIEQDPKSADALVTSTAERVSAKLRADEFSLDEITAAPRRWGRRSETSSPRCREPMRSDTTSTSRSCLARQSTHLGSTFENATLTNVTAATLFGPGRARAGQPT